jgi:mRNA-degrading endonuclease RelE of RelBE toxin-antitoxin system
MTWTSIVAKPAQKQLERVPGSDRARIVQAFEAMRRNPFEGDVAQLRNRPANFRRRVGAWRIFFDLDPDAWRIDGWRSCVGDRRRTGAADQLAII